jgi:hypothetical protein
MTNGEEPSPPLRIGNTERTAAMKALDEHLAEGRLTVQEYGDRTAAAANAVVAADLAALFTDLPEPHPHLPGTRSVPPSTAPLPLTPAPEEIVPAKSGALAYWAPRLVPVTVILAVALYVITRQWMVFLLIPLVAVLAGASRSR